MTLVTQARWRWAAELVATLSLLVVASMLLAYVCVFYKPMFSSDDAVVNMLADAMHQQGRLLPRGWINNNGDLMVPSGALVVAVLMGWGRNSYALHAVASVLAFLLMLGSLAWLLHVLRMPRIVTLAILTFVASGVSVDFTIMVFAQTTYFWWAAGFCAGAALVFRHREADPDAFASGDRLSVVCLFLLVFCTSFANPGRVGLMMVVPLYVLDRSLAWTRRRTNRDIASTLGLRDRVVLVGLGASFLCAAGLYAALARLGVTQSSYNAAALWWGGVPSLWRHLSTFRGWFDYLGAGINPWEQNLAGFTWIAWFRRSAAWLVTGWSIYCIIRIRSNAGTDQHALTWALLAAFIPIFAIYVMFEPLAVSGSTLRYFIVPMTIMFVLASFGLGELVSRFPTAGSWALAGAAMLLVPLTLQRFIPLSTAAVSPAQPLADMLRTEGLHWGYATWWNAGRTTVLSEGSVRVNPVNISGGGVLSPFGYMVLSDWYRPSTWIGPTFLALKSDELKPETPDVLQGSLGAPRKIIDAGDYRVFVYPYNIASAFSCETSAQSDVRLVKGGPLPYLAAASLDTPAKAARTRILTVTIMNGSKSVLSGSGRYPLSIGLQLLHEDGSMAERDWSHVLLQCPVSPGGKLSMRIPLPPVQDASSKVRVDLVQEGVAWLSDWGGKTFVFPLGTDAAPRPVSRSMDEGKRGSHE